MEEGRPPKFKNPEEMMDLIEEYINSGEVLTVTGLALRLGFASRQSIYDYEKIKEFSYIVKRGLLLVENGYEKRLHGTTPTGAIFAMKNMGWKDKQELDLHAEIETDNVFTIVKKNADTQ